MQDSRFRTYKTREMRSRLKELEIRMVEIEKREKKMDPLFQDVMEEMQILEILATIKIDEREQLSMFQGWYNPHPPLRFTILVGIKDWRDSGDLPLSFVGLCL